MEETETKVCSKCGLEKPICDFYFDKMCQRYVARCRKCLADAAKLYYHKDIEKSRKNCNDRYAKNLNKMRKQKYLVKQRRKQNNPKAFMLESARGRAKDKRIEFDITIEDIVIPEICPVLGIPLIFSHGRATDNSPSLDRIDNTKGYVKGNICVISNRANRLKNDATIEEVEKILEYIRGLTKLKHPL